MKVGDRILFDDGYVGSKVVEVLPHGVIVETENSGVIKSGKGVNIPAANLNLPVVTEKDITDINLAASMTLILLQLLLSVLPSMYF